MTSIATGPAPRTTAGTDPAEVYRDGLAHGELRYQRCQWCSTRFSGVSLLCATCGGTDVVWERSSGHGRIHALPRGSELADRRGCTAVVELDEGFRMHARLAPSAAHQLWRGAPVELLEVAEAHDGSLRPVFRPVAA